MEAVRAPLPPPGKRVDVGAGLSANIQCVVLRGTDVVEPVVAEIAGDTTD